jgi:lipid A 3-O-deacylase
VRAARPILGRRSSLGPWLAVALLAASCAAPQRRLVLIEENDQFSSGAGEDRDYSQGAELRYETEQGSALERVGATLLQPLALLDPLPAAAAEDRFDRRDVQWFLQQRVYNPDDLDASAFVPDQRPYAGVLLLGFRGRHVRLDPDAGRRRDWLHTVHLALGATGDAALGEVAQRGTHYLLGEADAQGWDNQLDDELLFQTGFDLRARTLYGAAGSLECDVLTGGAAELGTGFTHLAAGFDLRLGRGLPRDRRPWAEDPLGVAVYAHLGSELRYAIFDLTLDGSLWNDDPPVDLSRQPWVAQWFAGLAVEYAGFTVAYRFLRQTKEYEEELGYHDWGTVVLGYRYTF